MLCWDLVLSWKDISEAEREAFLDEILRPDIMLCPNTTSLFVEGGLEGGTFLELSIYGTDLAYEEEIISKSVIY